MNIIIVSLILVVSFRFPGGSAKFQYDWHNALPWAKDLPKEEYKENILLYLLRKDWRPKGPHVPVGDEIVPEYPGTVGEAYSIFMDETNKYEFHKSELPKAIEILNAEFGYNPELESIFVIHTISGDGENYFNKNIMIALALRNLIKQYNVFAFNMPGMQPSMEQTIIKSIYGRKANYEDFGDTIGSFFNTAIKQKLIRPDQIHLMGFCYSSQLAGYIARSISSNNNNQKIKSIAALDPYSVGFSGIRNKVLSKDDAQVVHAYHTNSVAMGSLYRRATADFNFNSGLSQPGCYFSKNVMCSHRRAPTAFWYVILYPDLWLARKCSSWLRFKLCLCNSGETSGIPFPPTPGPTGKYYFNTGSGKPYGYGPPGANCYTRNMDTKKQKAQKNKIDSKRQNFKTVKQN